MKHLLAALFCIVIPLPLFAVGNGYNVTYDGGSLPDTKAGTRLKLYIEASQVRLVKSEKELAIIPTAAVTEISYGQEVHRRVGTAVAVAVVSLGPGILVALSKSKKHYVGLTWANRGQKGGLVLQCDKNEYRGILAGLEGTTGKRAVNSEAMGVSPEAPHVESAAEAAKASKTETATQPATTHADVMPAPVQVLTPAVTGMTPQEEPLGDVARRLRGEKASQEQQEAPNQKP